MKIAVVRMPGANCDQDALHALRDGLGVEAEYVWHQESKLRGFDGVFVPGGFTYGDYLRVGAIASQSPAIAAVRQFAERGGPVLGVCNGFQILCESGLLPGALLPNASGRFACHDVELIPTGDSHWVEGLGRRIVVPIAHGEGRYVADAETLDRIERHGQVAFRYVDNPNGSERDIAGVTNARGNVLGMMPHPERAWSELLLGSDGLGVLEGFLRLLARR